MANIYDEFALCPEVTGNQSKVTEKQPEVTGNHRKSARSDRK